MIEACSALEKLRAITKASAFNEWLGLEVTAEWVETIVQAERLSELGCDTGQGRWFGDAGPGEWVPELYRRSISD